MAIKKIILAILLLITVFSTPCYAAKYSKVEILPYANNSNTPKLAIKVNLLKGAKTYWRIAGESGAAPRFNWKDSENIKKFKVNFPAPKRFEYMGIESYGYDEDVIFPVDIKLNNPNKDSILRLQVELLICKDLCIPENHNIELFLGNHINHYLEIKDALDKLPIKLTDKNLLASWISNENRDIFVNFKIANIPHINDSFDIFLENTAMTILDKPEIRKASDGVVHVKSKVRYLYDVDSVKKELENQIITLTLSNGKKAYELTSIFTNNPEGKSTNLNYYKLRIILIALLGGLILNLMPCVLPVLSIKILSILKNGGSTHNKSEITKSLLSTALGIITSFWLIAIGLSILRHAGEAIGWGIQFQYPPFLIFLILVLLFFAANLWGLFEILLPNSLVDKMADLSKGKNFFADFFTGMFATLLATPCSAPFLGTAITFALSSSYFDIFLIFTFLGLGLAAPYIALSFTPKVFKYLPKPGNWMIALKRILSITILLTAIWLSTILYSIHTQQVINSEWQKFDYALIEPAINKGKIVFVDITAKWCLTCKANKKFVLETQDTKQILNAQNILKLQGDWTAKDKYISEYLKHNNRYGVPFNIIYSKKYPQGLPLPEILNKKIITEAIFESTN